MLDPLDEFHQFVRLACLRRGIRVGEIERGPGGSGRISVRKGREEGYLALSGLHVEAEGPPWVDAIADEVDADVNRDLVRYVVLA